MKNPFRLPPTLLVGLLLQTAPMVVRALDNDFSAYPEGSQDCLYQSADESQCSGNTGHELNACLCSNQGNFIYDSASCIAKQSPSDLDTVYSTLKNNCEGTGDIIVVSRNAFLDQAEAATKTTSSTTPTSSTSATNTATTTGSGPTATSTDNPSSDISTSAKIGLGVGIGFGAIALGLLGWFVFTYSRRRRSRRGRGALNSSSSSSSSSHGAEGAEAGAYGMTSTSATKPPTVEFAQQNKQEGGAAELGAADAAGGHGNPDWKPNKPMYAEMSGQGKPLLAELGGGGGRRGQDSAAPVDPVELPGSEAFLGFSDHHQNSNPQYSDGDGGLSPAAPSSQSGRPGDVSPYSDRHSSGTGTY
ncbi:hypothetical protein F4780DRAFT_668373 [Xylariomycetidae sp. FL0641]|nr:hypothetical protein F4780DRAFT_668373 [Xylariomycetidae sp. FL0641]